MVSHVKVDFGPSTAQRTVAHWTRQTSSVTGRMAKQIAKIAQIVDTAADANPPMTIVGRMGFLARTCFLWASSW